MIRLKRQRRQRTLCWILCLLLALETGGLGTAWALAPTPALDENAEPPAESPPALPSRPARGAPAPSAATTAAVESATKASGIPLVPDFNLVSLPDQPPDPDPAAVLAPIAGNYSAVFAYDACDAADPWKLYDPDDPAASDLEALDPAQGLWIDATEPLVLPSSGSQPAVTSRPPRDRRSRRVRALAGRPVGARAVRPAAAGVLPGRISSTWTDRCRARRSRSSATTRCSTKTAPSG